MTDVQAGVPSEGPCVLRGSPAGADQHGYACRISPVPGDCALQDGRKRRGEENFSWSHAAASPLRNRRSTKPLDTTAFSTRMSHPLDQVPADLY